MKYTRRFFDQFEWLHNPISPIEQSLMLPLQIDGSINLISKRLSIKVPQRSWIIIGDYLYFSNEYWKLFLQPAILFLPFRLFQEIRVAKARWIEDVVPKYQNKIDSIKIIDLKEKSIKELLQLLKEMAELEGWFFSEALHVGFICGLTEILLKVTFNYFVKNASSDYYHNLLLGFPDKGLESDTKLWEIAQSKDSPEKLKRVEDWIEKYGHRIQDKDVL